jgi:hypothetical protein
MALAGSNGTCGVGCRGGVLHLPAIGEVREAEAGFLHLRKISSRTKPSEAQAFHTVILLLKQWPVLATAKVAQVGS